MSKGFKYFLIRLAVFLAGFLVVSGIIGPWLIPTPLLYGAGFYIYGNLGKLVLYSAILFVLFVRDSLPIADKPSLKSFNWVFLVLAGILTAIFFPLANQLVEAKTGLFLILAHATLIAIPALMFLFAFPLANIKKYLQDYKKQLFACLGISIVFDIGIFQVWKLWPIFSSVVLLAVRWLFSLTYADVYTPGQLTIYVHGFGVRILEACSGVDSLFLFSALYLIITVLDWKKFNHLKVVLAFFPAAIGLFLVNILRVYIIILAGVIISPAVTEQLFHTYAGMLLFIAYFGVFWAIMYRRLKRQPKQNG